MSLIPYTFDPFKAPPNRHEPWSLWLDVRTLRPPCWAYTVYVRRAATSGAASGRI